MVRSTGLGKGLRSIIPEGSDSDVSLFTVAIDAITPNPNQPRRTFDEAGLDDLATSIGSLGVLQPILVREGANGMLELIAGERRWRAAKRAGLTEIPVLLRESDDLASLEVALVENLHRSDLNPIEEAMGYAQLIEEFHYAHKDLADRVGRSRPYISNLLRLLRLPPELQQYIVEGRLSSSQGRCILSTSDPELQRKVAAEALDGGLKNEQIDRRIKELEGRLPEPDPNSGPHSGASSRQATGSGVDIDLTADPDVGSVIRDPAVLELEHRLGERFATKVTVNMGTRRGRVVIDFAGVEDLERIYRSMMGLDEH